MQRKDLGNYVLIGLIVVTIIVYAARSSRRAANEVNPHDPSVGRIDAFQLQPGEVGLTVKVLREGKPAARVHVWAQSGGDDDTGRLRTGQSDERGLVRVPMRKGRGDMRVFARNAAGHVGGARLDASRLLSAPDIVLVDVAPREGRLLTSTGAPIVGATIAAKTFMGRHAAEEGAAGIIEVPRTLQAEYAAKTDAEGRFRVPVPTGFDCRFAFQTDGYGAGHIWLPAEAAGECRLQPSGEVRVQMSGDGKAGEMRGLRCRLLVPNDIPHERASDIRVEGQRTVQHDGSERFAIGNVVPGKYRVQIEGTPQNPALPAEVPTLVLESGKSAVATIPLKTAGRITGRAIDGKSEAALPGVRFALTCTPNESGYGGYVVTGADGRFAAYVPAGERVLWTVNDSPPGYGLPKGGIALLFTQENTVSVASGESKALPDTKLYTQGTVSGVVVAGGKPVSGATVEVCWDALQNRRPVSLKTDSAGRFEIADAPPGQPITLRVRAFGMVNANVALSAEDIVGPLQVALSADNVFRLRGVLGDARGQPIERAKVVISGNIKMQQQPFALPQVREGPEAKEPQQQLMMPTIFQPVELEAVFSDSAGRFESGPLWPGCTYALAISADGAVPRQVGEIEAQPGQVHEVPRVLMRRTSGVVAGKVVDTSGAPLAGATVIDCGDGPRRVTANTDAGGNFSLKGLYDGPALVSVHKSGYRWSYGIIRPGAAEATIALRSRAEPPAAIAALSKEQVEAHSELIRRLQERVAKEQPGPPRDANADAAKELEEIRKDLDGYLARVTKENAMAASSMLLPLARRLAKDDPDGARRVLKEAAVAAGRATMPRQVVAFLPMAEMSANVRALELIRVGRTAAELGLREDATTWLRAAEVLTAKLSDKFRRQPVEELAVAWVSIDPARTEKLLTMLGGDTSVAVSGIVSHLLQSDVKQALPWLERFRNPHDHYAEVCRAQVAARLARRDLPGAIGLAESIEDPTLRGQTWVQLAAMAQKQDRKLAETLINKAAVALADSGKPNDDHEPSARLSLALSLLWQAKALDYPDLASLVAQAMSARMPAPLNEQVGSLWSSQLLQLAAGVASIDPVAGKSLLNPETGLGDLIDRKEHEHTWLMALALSDPAAALKHVNDGGEVYARSLLSILERRSNVLGELGLATRWFHDAGGE